MNICVWHTYLQTDTCQYNASAAVANIRDWDVLMANFNYDNLTGEPGMQTVVALHGPVAALFVQTYANSCQRHF
jgi:hypothetical protein